MVEKFEDLSQKWNFTPPIVELMPYLKKLLVDNHIQLIGIVAGYDKDKNGKDVPYVYQILGENIRKKACRTECKIFLKINEYILLYPDSSIRNVWLDNTNLMLF